MPASRACWSKTSVACCSNRVPASTPPAVVQRLNAEINKALQSADVRDKLAQQGAEPLGSSAEEYGAYVKKELNRWAVVVKSTGVTLD